MLVSWGHAVVRYRLTVAYDGTEFHGWQKQHPPAEAHPEIEALEEAEYLSGPGEGRVSLRTVQGVLERAVQTVCRERVVLTGASRTDAGVHARGQVAAFTSVAERGVGWPAERGADRLVRALNGVLPEDLVVREAAIVHAGFDPIGDALEKEYTYVFACGPMRPLWDRRFVYWSWHELNVEAMAEAAARFVGEHDFAAFAQINHGRKTTVRTVFRCSVEAGAPGRVTMRVSGSGFLYNMVRIMAGTLFEVGRGRRRAEDVAGVIASRDRRRAGPTLPAEGLRLEWIRYPEAIRL